MEKVFGVQTGSETDIVTWDALWRMAGAFGAIMLAAWGLLMRMVGGKVDKAQLLAQSVDNQHRFDEIDSTFEELRNSLKGVESRQDTRHMENTARLSRIETLLIERLPQRRGG